MLRVNPKLTYENKALRSFRLALAVFAAALAGGAGTAAAQDMQQQRAPLAQSPTYVDLVTLAERADLVIRAQIRDQITVKPERAPGLKPGFARLYLEGDTSALLAGSARVSESLAWLVDVPLDAKGKPPKLEESVVLLFADPVAGRPGTIVLVNEQGQMPYSPALEARIRGVLTALVANDAPPVITGIADALSVRGNLAGESETQIFLTTRDRSPVSISVLRRPGQPPAWGVSWGEIIDSSARAPQPGTLRWYRLACALPGELPSSANLSRDPDARRLAEVDYAFVLRDLGECARTITKAE